MRKRSKLKDLSSKGDPAPMVLWMCDAHILYHVCTVEASLISAKYFTHIIIVIVVVIVISFERPFGSHLRLIGLVGSLSLPIYISQIS